MTAITAHNQTELDAILSPTDADQAAEALWSHRDPNIYALYPQTYSEILAAINVVAAMAREA